MVTSFRLPTSRLLHLHASIRKMGIPLLHAGWSIFPLPAVIVDDVSRRKMKKEAFEVGDVRCRCEATTIGRHTYLVSRKQESTACMKARIRLTRLQTFLSSLSFLQVTFPVHILRVTDTPIACFQLPGIISSATFERRVGTRQLPRLNST